MKTKGGDGLTDTVTFKQATDGVLAHEVPHVTLSSGGRIPCIGLGTFGSDRFGPAEVARAVLGAAEVGYRHFDCASVYGNEPEVGRAFEVMLKAGIKREELWITSKVWNDSHNRVEASCEKSLRDLKLDYLDLFLVHWPFPNHHPPGCDVDVRSPEAVPYVHEQYMTTWRQMERLVSRGLVRHIGTSNMTVPKLRLLLRDCAIRPVANEMELHPHFQQPELFDYVLKNGMVPIGYCPIGSPKRPERDRTQQDTVDTQDPVVIRIAARHQMSPATLCVKWAAQRGQIPIPFSVTRANYLANLKSVCSPPLSREEMAELASIDRNCRLIKGQVFLWQGAKSWEDLWDMSGQITAG